MKLNVCQVLKCKKLESPDHVGTLCKKHSEIMELNNNATYGIYRHPFVYKKTNEKNNVWENGIENVRAIPTIQINRWLKDQKEKKKTFEEMLKVIQEQIEEKNEKIADLEKTKNMRYSR